LKVPCFCGLDTIKVSNTASLHLVGLCVYTLRPCINIPATY